MSELVTGAATNIIEYLPGLRAYTSPRGIRVIELDWWATPLHAGQWEADNRRFYTTKDWRREYERDWTSPAGLPVFPEFSAIGKDRFIRMATNLMKGPVYRAFDLGRRRPAAVWFQYSPRSDRLWWYREFMPHDIGTHAFRDAVKYLSNQLGYQELPAEARQWVDAYAAKPSGSHCPPPWFPLGTRFIDIAGKEALQQQANAIKQEDAVAADIFAAGEMPLAIVDPSVEGRYQLVRRFLRMYPDGEPGLWLDPQVEEGAEMLDGALSYPEPSPKVPIPSKPKNDGHFINLSDAFGYGVAAVAPDDKPGPQPEQRVVGYRDGREPIYASPAESVGWAKPYR